MSENKKVIPFDDEERELIVSIENDEWVPIVDDQTLRAQAASAARNTLKKDKRINLRLTEKDFHLIQIRAVEEGIPYQTLISSIIHKYLNGTL